MSAIVVIVDMVVGSGLIVCSIALIVEARQNRRMAKANERLSRRLEELGKDLAATSANGAKVIQEIIGSHLDHLRDEHGLALDDVRTELEALNREMGEW